MSQSDLQSDDESKLSTSIDTFSLSLLSDLTLLLSLPCFLIFSTVGLTYGERDLSPLLPPLRFLLCDLPADLGPDASWEGVTVPFFKGMANSKRQKYIVTSLNYSDLFGSDSLKYFIVLRHWEEDRNRTVTGPIDMG